MRIGIGAVLLYILLRHWDERLFLWGPNGVYPVGLFTRDLPTLATPSFFAVESELAFDALYVALIVAATLFMVGWQTRWVGVWLYVLTWSLVHRNPLLLTGGERLLIVTMPFIVFMLDTQSHFSISAWLRRRHDRPPTTGPVLALIHNLGVWCILVQLSIVYGFSGLGKLSGESWRDGTAVYYALRAPEFSLAGAGELIYMNGTLVPLLTYATLAFELAFPLLIWSQRTRWVPQLLAVVFHLFTAVFMGLTLFAAQALVFQLVLVDDPTYRRFAGGVKHLVRGIARG